MKYLIDVVKDVMKALGTNKTAGGIDCVGKVIGTIASLLQ